MTMAEKLKPEQIHICKAEKLLAAIFCVGVCCPKCGRELDPRRHYKHNPYCSACWYALKHPPKTDRRPHPKIDVVCDECGNTFKRYQSKLVHCLGKDNYQHVFCGHSCQAHWLSKRSKSRGIRPKQPYHIPCDITAAEL